MFIRLPGSAMKSLSPRTVARAIGVSESSLKRWCDRGLLATSRTAGGHRRLTISAVLQFVREHHYPLNQPELLGLPASIGSGTLTIDRAHQRYLDAMIAGDEAVAGEIVFDLYLASHRISVICDRVIRPCFEEIGRRWECGQLEVHQERHACTISGHVLHDLREVLPLPASGAPVAIGGGPEGDNYALATTMAELVLRESGWQAMSLGVSLPLASLAAAAQRFHPRILWLTVSHLGAPVQFVADYRQYLETLADRTAIVVGGRALEREIRSQIRYSSYGESMADLEAFAQAFHPTRSATSDSRPESRWSGGGPS